MKTLVLGEREVAEALPMAECIKAMEDAFRAAARGEAGFPPRSVMPAPGVGGVLGMMPGYLRSPSIIGVKAVSVFPGNMGTKFESHQGVVLLFEGAHGALLAVVDAGSITRIRTGAASAVATKHLSREGSSTLAIVGSGTQAASHFEAMLAARPGISRVRVWSRSADNAKRFVEAARSRAGVDVVRSASPEEAVSGADIVCTVTGATSPVVEGGWLSAGTHVNAVGASRPPGRELDTEAVAKARFFVDSRESARLEADDFLVPLREGAIGPEHIIGEIGEVLEGKVEGRTSESDVTVFKSLGLAVEDLAAAVRAYERASAAGVGAWLELGGERSGAGLQS